MPGSAAFRAMAPYDGSNISAMHDRPVGAGASQEAGEAIARTNQARTGKMRIMLIPSDRLLTMLPNLIVVSRVNTTIRVILRKSSCVVNMCQFVKKDQQLPAL